MQNPFFRFLELLQKLRGWFLELPWQIRWGGLGVAVIGITLIALPQSLFHSFNCELQNLPQSYGSSNGYFVDSQVIVVGSRDDVDDVIATPTPFVPGTPPTVIGIPSATGTPGTPVNTATPPVEVQPGKVILNLIEGCDLSYLDSRNNLDPSAARAPQNLVMRLYEIPKGSTVGGVIAEIDSKAGNKEIFADPNYLTRLADSTSDPCALPGDAGGSGGRPFGGPGLADPQKAKDAFMRQWAFGSDGINFSSLDRQFTGRGVRVGVFDTSPYRISFPFVKRTGEALPSPLWFPNWDAGGRTMVSNHGLFVAELIYAMAPNSRVQLIRVLNEDGCGELWVLNKGLEDYKSRMSAWTESLDKTVINMSLGIRLPEDDNTGSEQAPGNATPEANVEPEQEELEKLAEERVDTLQKLIDEADRMGAIIIAAAGNSSDRTNGSPNKIIRDMEVPASYDNVYGVTATNPAKEPSCYSNTGDIAAPGGEGGRVKVKNPSGPPDERPCGSKASTWNTELDPCPDGTVHHMAHNMCSGQAPPLPLHWSAGR
jgi:hypothetical protein